ncbi:cysteine desulfurase [Staphylococcus arlettae]|uniref:cysteine desulfurase family protein n=1 Tax=Staphylococcus TaxID=1279 RepID=UPI0003914164|nr:MULTISPECIES: cysteine desulfurase family protein [Staphylococcus]ERF47887.1 aminotransferase [Staphylococcus sp. EGD-HP3]MCD8816697.1 cysteine desulfurase [Staphylococcus arlettae]MCD8838374.1 cysteine desulfurase [Staphylococcus arlettae]MCD8848648.1 cysteine desulfurase [Staphylococcus arlettae]MCD8865453.1 cysteine desulfurase [Staphylococcus arlettae]
MIYLDNAATTKPNQDVLDTFVKVNQSLYFNPNSPHKAGLQAEQLLQQTKREIKELLQLNNAFEVLFTSGATESNNIALQGIARKKKAFAPEIITSVLEHPSVLEVVRALADEGFCVKYVNITAEGQVDVNHLASMMSDRVGLVTCMHVNNIMGQIQPIPEIAEIVSQYPKAHFHVDAVQAIGKIPLYFNQVDSMSLSGHKFNGLKGQGVLFVRNIHQLAPIMYGGGQEFGIRSGTVNLPTNIAIVKAMKSAVLNQASTFNMLQTLKTQLISFIEEFQGVYLNSPEGSSPHIINIAFPGVKGEVLVNAFSKYDVMLSTTSACSSKKASLNEVLLAMGITEKRIEGSIRLSLGSHTTVEDIEDFKAQFIKVYEEVKELLK